CQAAAACAPRILSARGSQGRIRTRTTGIMQFELTTGSAVLERTPHVLGAMLGGLQPEWTDGTEGPDTWSPYVIVGHLIHGERTDWIPRARIFLEHGPDRRF